VIFVFTLHKSKRIAEFVEQVILSVEPDTIGLEVDKGRFRKLRALLDKYLYTEQHNKLLFRVFGGLSAWDRSSYGADMAAGIVAGESIGARTYPIDSITMQEFVFKWLSTRIPLQKILLSDREDQMLQTLLVLPGKVIVTVNGYGHKDGFVSRIDLLARKKSKAIIVKRFLRYLLRTTKHTAKLQS